MKKMGLKNYISWKGLLIFFILILMINFYNVPGVGDVNIWNIWMDYANQYGIIEGYSLQDNMYPPLSLIIQILMKKACPFLTNFEILKITNLFFLLISVIIMWILYKNIKIVIISFGALFLSTNLGYLDIEMVPFLVLACYFLKKEKYILFGIFGAVLCLVKYQVLIIAPFVIAYFVDLYGKSKYRIGIKLKIKELLKATIPLIILGVGVCLIYKGKPLIALYKAIFGVGGVTISPNALNFGWVLQFLLEIFCPHTYGALDNGRIVHIWSESPQQLYFKYIFVLLYMMAFVIMLVRKNKDIKLLLQCSLIGYTSYFLYNSGVHENHLFLGMVLMILLYLSDPIMKNYFRMIMYIVIFNINLLIFYGISGRGLDFNRIINKTLDPTLLLAVFNVIYLTITYVQIVLEIIGNEENISNNGEKT